MKPVNHGKTSRKEQKILNPGPAENGRAYRTGNPSGIENKSVPQGRSGTTDDQSQTEKQNQ